MKRRRFLESGILTGAGLGIVPAVTAQDKAIGTADAKPQKRTLWMLIADMTHPELHLVTPTIAWMAEEAGADFETYQEAQRDGKLFARTGSTVLGGSHHQQFNYLNVVYTVKYIILGDAPLFRSSINMFGATILAESHSIAELYRALLKVSKIAKPKEAFVGLCGLTQLGGKNMELGPYLFPEVFFRKALAFSAQSAKEASGLIKENGIQKVGYFLNTPEEKKAVLNAFSKAQELDSIADKDSYATITLRIAERWKSKAKGLAFGDPAAILSQISSHCRMARIAVYGEKKAMHPSQVQVTAYTEQETVIAEDVKRLAKEIGNLVIVGRQTGDGDLFEWSKGGVCIQIMDPNRPAFPIVETLPHTWAKSDKTVYEDEPDDATLVRYAEEGKVLATLMWHSGEMAHNEAMLNLFEIVSETGIKMGMGVHAARYETAPQLWELINVPREKGGVKGYIEPVLHSGGMGVLAEVNCPPDILQKHCQEALSRIRKLAGDGATPRGYYAFIDTDYSTLSSMKPEIYKAVENSGLEYFVSSVSPGRNRIVHESGKCLVLNQTARSISGASPFVRITTLEDFKEGSPTRPGWFIGTLDAPVISFNHYIWRYGHRFMEIVDHIMSNKSIVTATPHMVARYARLLKERGFLPKKV